MRLTLKTLIATTALSVSLWPTSAQADWLFTPYLGGNIGGDTVETQPNFGISAAWMGSGAIGFEFDAGWVPEFFDPGIDDATALVSDSSLSTYMFNVIVGAPVGGQTGLGVRPYGSAGIGAIQTRVESDLGLVDSDSTDFGWNAGAGVMGFFHDRIGVRGDVRYFGSVQNDLADNPLTEGLGRFNFWRVTGGVVLRFGTN